MAADVQVNAEIDGNEGIENQPLSGTLVITHNLNQPIDSQSIMLRQKKLEVEHIKDVRISPDDPLTLSMYHFQLPGQPAGLYSLPRISVKVNGQDYQSSPASYEVKAASSLQFAAPPASPSSQSSSAPPLLRLEALIKGKSTLYPGQTTQFVYRYLFRGNIELVTEKIPLLDATGLIKIGEKDNKEYMQGDINVSEISQAVEAQNPGTFSYGPSLIEGYAYQEDLQGRRVRVSEKLRSEAPPVQLTVLPFPAKDRPPSFNGAVGQFQFEASLLSAPNLVVGNAFSLELKFTAQGNADLRSVHAPNLSCQPGYGGFFQINDLPPVEQVQGDEKKVVLQLRPLNAEMKELPPIQFSYFDPEKESYALVYSKALPVTVKPVKTAQPAPPPAEIPARQNKFYLPQPLEISGIGAPQSSALCNKLFGCLWVLGILPAGLALLLYQRHIRAYVLQRQAASGQMRSQELLSQALMQMEPSARAFSLLEQALQLSLVEAEATADLQLSSAVKQFLDRITAQRFSEKGKLDLAQIQQEALLLHQKILAHAPHSIGAQL